MREVGAIVWVLLLGCSSSPLVRSDDRTFTHAAERFQRTAVALQAERLAREATATPPPDETLFLQAESLYRYRWELRSPSARAYAAQAAAAATDFMPLGVWAASS